MFLTCVRLALSSHFPSPLSFFRCKRITGEGVFQKGFLETKAEPDRGVVVPVEAGISDDSLQYQAGSYVCNSRVGRGRTRLQKKKKKKCHPSLSPRANESPQKGLNGDGPPAPRVRLELRVASSTVQLRDYKGAVGVTRGAGWKGILRASVGFT